MANLPHPLQPVQQAGMFQNGHANPNTNVGWQGAPPAAPQGGGYIHHFQPHVNLNQQGFTYPPALPGTQNNQGEANPGTNNTVPAAGNAATT